MTPRARIPGLLGGFGLALHIAWIAGAVALLVLGPPQETRELSVAVVAERVPGVRTAREPAPYERVVEVALRRVAELDPLDLVPDPRAMRTRVRPAMALRVLDPERIELAPLSLPRIGRPLALEARVPGAEPGDELLRIVQGERQTLAGQWRDGVLRAVLELSPLARARERIELVWRGTRGERLGEVSAVFELAAQPAPRVWVAPEVVATRSLVRALELQGFERTDARHESDLVVASLSGPAPSGLAEAVDRGQGCVLVAAPGGGVDPSVESLAPVVAVPVVAASETTDPTARSGGETTAPKSTTGGETARPPERGERAASDPDATRRVGAVGDRERAEAMRRAGRKGTKAVALVLLLDSSGSMNQPASSPRIEMAKRGAIETAKTLGDGDEFAVVTFGTRPRVALPLGPARRRAELERAVLAVRADASETWCYPGLEEAWRLLKQTRAPVRHIVILTDGDFTDGFKPYDRILRAMRDQGIGVSGLGVRGEGSYATGAFSFLKRMLAQAGGSLKTTRNANEIPTLLLGEVEEVLTAARPLDTGGAAMDSPPPRVPPEAEPPTANVPPRVEQPKVDPPAQPKTPIRHRLNPVDLEPVLAGFASLEWPSVEAYVPLEARQRARVHLAVGDAGHAYLTTAPYGLGRVAAVAFGEEAWAGPLTRQPWFPQLAGQLGAWLLPAEPSGRLLPARCRRVASEVVAGDGAEPGTLAVVAERVGGRIESTPSDDLGSVAKTVPGALTPWLLALLGGYLALLLVELLRRRTRARQVV